MHIQGLADFLSGFSPSGKNEWLNLLKKEKDSFSENDLFHTSLNELIRYSIFQDETGRKYNSAFKKNISAWKIRMDFFWRELAGGCSHLKTYEAADTLCIHFQDKDVRSLDTENLKLFLSRFPDVSELFFCSSPEDFLELKGRKNIIRNFTGLFLFPDLEDSKNHKSPDRLFSPSFLKKISEASAGGMDYRIGISGDVFRKSGGTIVQELAFSLACGAEILSFLTEQGMRPEEAEGLLLFQFETGPEFYLETAKYRVFRFLWKIISSQFSAEKSSEATLHALSSQFYFSVYDIHSNLIRRTLQSLSAVLGGADAVMNRQVPPELAKGLDFDACGRDILLMIRHECGISHLEDPLDGSYSFQEIMETLSENVWDLFLQVQDRGGFLQCMGEGWIQSEIAQRFCAKKVNFFNRKIKVAGVNIFVNPRDALNENLNIVKSVSSAAEKIRNLSDLLAADGKRPEVLLCRGKDEDASFSGSIESMVQSLGCRTRILQDEDNVSFENLMGEDFAAVILSENFHHGESFLKAPGPSQKSPVFSMKSEKQGADVFSFTDCTAIDNFYEKLQASLEERLHLSGGIIKR